jgi:hypothetical protein
MRRRGWRCSWRRGARWWSAGRSGRGWRRRRWSGGRRGSGRGERPVEIQCRDGCGVSRPPGGRRDRCRVGGSGPEAGEQADAECRGEQSTRRCRNHERTDHCGQCAEPPRRRSTCHEDNRDTQPRQCEPGEQGHYSDRHGFHALCVHCRLWLTNQPAQYRRQPRWRRRADAQQHARADRDGKDSAAA